MSAQVVVSIDASGNDLRISFGSMSKSGEVSGAEKVLVSKAVNEANRAKSFPKITKISSSGARK